MNEMALVKREDNELAVWSMMTSQAEVLVKSGLIPPAYKQKESALAVMLMGREIGVGPMQSLNGGIHYIDGKLSVAPQVQQALVLKSGKIRDLKIAEGPGWCEATATRTDTNFTFTTKYTIQDATKAGLNAKKNWTMYPANMLRWRCLGYLWDVLCPDVVGGLYTPDELGAETDADGNLPKGSITVLPATQPSPVVEEKKAVVDKYAMDKGKQDHLVALWKATKKLGVVEAEWREFLKSHWGVESTKALTDNQVNEWELRLASSKSKADMLYVAPEPAPAEPEPDEGDIIEAEITSAEPAAESEPATTQPAKKVRRGL